MYRVTTFIFTLILSSIFVPRVSAAPNVVATILPLHALVVGVTEGVSRPKLLIKGGHSPHSYSLRPSDAKALEDANLILWVGPELESFLVTPLNSLASTAAKLELLKQKELVRLPQRTGGVWDSFESLDHAGADHAASSNPHLWLDPQNAVNITRLLASKLTELDPKNGRTYKANAQRLEERLQRLDQKIDQQLDPVRELPYLVFHDAYHYYEQRYALQPLGAISISPERRPGAKRISEIRKMVQESKARCVFAEPQFKPQMVETLISGTSVAVGILDPIGADLTPGVDSYFTLLEKMTENLKKCLMGSTRN
ncbi:MAG TPA: zinc ABC transporter substrate-binding protein [Geopsychrobacteraceae bacterium]|nr:zinc ABC transporter substrate-binding protein [Geopsychrobacteraceae bacterium]